MTNKLFNLVLDLSGRGIVPHIEIRRNDYDSNVFSVQVTQNGLPFDFTGMNPIFECLTPDGHYIRDDGSQYGTIHVVDATQGKLEYTLVNEVFAVLGQIDVAYFAFEQSNADLQNPTNRVSTGNFSMRIIADALTGTTAAQDYMSDVTTLIQQINQLKTDYQTLNPTNYVTQTQFGTQNDSVASQLAETGVLVSPFKTDQNTWADAINAAINMSAKKTIQLPPETMDIVGQQINVVDGLKVYGKKGKTFITSSVQVDTAFGATSAVSDIGFYGVGFIGGVVDEGQIVPTRQRTSNPSFNHAIHFIGNLMPDGSSTINVKNVEIIGCIFKNIADIPTDLAGISGYARIFDSDFDNCLDVGFIYSENVFFSRNHVTRSADNGVSLSRGNQRITCLSNIIEHSAYCGIWLSGWSQAGALGSGPIDFSCVGNVIIDSGWDGLQLEDAPQHGIIASNIVDGVLKGPVDGPDDAKGKGISVKPYPSNVYPFTDANIQNFAQNLIINNNIIMNAARGGMYIAGLKIGKISDNTILNCGSAKMADGVTNLVPASTENFGILFDPQSGDTIQDVDVLNNIIIDNRTETMSDGSRITNLPLLNGTTLRCRFKGNKAYGTQQSVTYGLKQDATNSNDLENFLLAKASTNSSGSTTAFVGADVEGNMRLGLLKKNGDVPYIATASGIPFRVKRLSTASVIDNSAIVSGLIKVDIDPGSSQPALYLGDDSGFIRLDINPLGDGNNGFRTERAFTASAGLRTTGTYNSGHIVLGAYHIWVDVNGRLRIKNGVPTSDGDGTVIITNPAASIASIPNYLGQMAIVGGVGYLATGTSSTADWKQITN